MRIYLTNLASDVAGFKLALIDERNPAATSTPATAITTLAAGSHSVTAGGTTTAMTLTAGGSAAKWITKPLKFAITTPAQPYIGNFWALRGSAAGHASIDWTVAPYTTSTQAAALAVMTTSHDKVGFWVNPMISSTTAQKRCFATATASSQAYSAGDRIVITPKVVNAFKSSTSTVATQSAGTLTMDFDGSLDGKDGDTWIDIPIGNTSALQGRTTKRQIVGTNTYASTTQFGKGFYNSLINNIDAAVGTGKFTKDCSLQTFYDELTYERDNN